MSKWEKLRRILTAEGKIDRPFHSMLEVFGLFASAGMTSVEQRGEIALTALAQVPHLLRALAQHGQPAAASPWRPVESFADTEEKKAAAQRLKSLLQQHRSDKANAKHGYHHFYGPLFAAQPIEGLLEIGIGTINRAIPSRMPARAAYRPGASLRAWRDFLPSAEIYGADIDRDILFQEERISTHYVDQTDATSWQDLARALPPHLDMVIDDGLHAIHTQLASLLFGLEHVRPGGWVVIEDITLRTQPVWDLVAHLLAPHGRCHRLQRHHLLFAVQKHPLS